MISEFFIKASLEIIYVQ